MTKKHHDRDEINVVSGGDFYEPFGSYNSILNFNHDPVKSDNKEGTFMKTFKISTQGGSSKREPKRTVMNHFDTAAAASRRSNDPTGSYFINDASKNSQHVHLRISIDHDNKNANGLINKSHLKATLNPMKSFYPTLNHHNQNDDEILVSNRKSKRRTTTGDSGQQNTPDTISSVGSSGGRNVDGLHSSRNIDRLIKMAGNWNSSKSRSSSVYSNVSVIMGNMANTPTKRMNSNSSSRDDPDYLMNNSMSSSNNNNLFVMKRSHHNGGGGGDRGGRGGNFYPSHSMDEGHSDLISLASNIHVTYNDLSEFDTGVKASGRGGVDEHSKTSKNNVSKQQKYRHRMPDNSPAGSVSKVRFDKVSQYMIKAQ